MKKILTIIGIIFILTLCGCGESQGKSAVDTVNTESHDTIIENTNTRIDTSSFAKETEYLEAQGFATPDWFMDYESIIEEYRIYVDYLINDELEKAHDNNVFSTPDSNLAYKWSCMQSETISHRGFPKTREDFGYAIEDLNGDGNSELILLSQDYTVLALFSMKNNTPKLLDAFWSRHTCAITNERLIYTLSSGGAAYWEYAFQRLSQESELIPVEKYGSTSEDGEQYYYYEVDGEKQIISEEKLNDIRERFPILTHTVAIEMTKSSGIKFIPLFD